MASSYQKKLIAEQQDRASKGITMSNDPRTHSSSGSSSKSTTSAKTVVVYDSSGKVTQSNDSSKPVGYIDTSKAKTSVLNSEANLVNKSIVYQRTGGTTTKTIYGTSGKESSSVVQTSKTPISQRQTTSKMASTGRAIANAQKSRNFKLAEAKVLNNTATSKDLMYYLSGGTGVVSNIVGTQDISRQIGFNKQQTETYNKNLNTLLLEVYTLLSANEQKLVDSKTISNKKDYLMSRAKDFSRQKIFLPSLYELPNIPKELTKSSKKLSGVSNAISSKLESWAVSMESRDKADVRKAIAKESNIVANRVFRGELVDEFFPKGTKFIGKTANSVINFSVKVSQLADGMTLGFAKELIKAGEKTAFMLPALGKSILDKRFKDFFREVSPFMGDRLDLMKQIYTDPKTYLYASIGAGFITLVGGVSSGKLTAKSVKTLPSKTIKYPYKTFLIDSANNIGFVSKSGVVKAVPKGLKFVTMSLTKDLRPTIFKSVKNIPKTSTAKVGTVFRNIKGEMRIVSKGGKIIKPTPAQARKLVINWKKGAKARLKSTEIARLQKKALKKPLKIKESLILKKAIKLKETKVNLVKIKSEIRQFSSVFKLKGKARVEYSKVYTRYRLNPSRLNTNRLERLINRMEIDKGIPYLDKLISKTLSKTKAKTKPKVTLKVKSKTKVKATQKDVLASKRLQAKSVADYKSKTKGFKNYAEEFNYYKIKKNFDAGVKGSDRAMRSFTRKLDLRKTKASIERVKIIKRTNNKLVSEANSLLKNGRIAIKLEVGKVKYIKPKYTPEETQRILRAIVSRENRIADLVSRRKAKEIIKRGLVKEEVEQVSSRTFGHIKSILNNEQMRLLKLDKIKKGLIKGKQLPTKTTTNAIRRGIKVQIKKDTRVARILRKKQKRSFAGESQRRKIIRKQMKKEIDSLDSIVRGTSSVPDGYILEVTTKGYKLVPKKTKIPSSAKIKTATEVIKKTKPVKGETLSVGKDGTISVLKSVTRKESVVKSSLSQRTKALKQSYAKLKSVTKKKTPTSKTVLVSKIKTKSVTRNISKLKTKKLSGLSSVGKVLGVATGLILASKRSLANTQGRFKTISPESISKLENDLRIDLTKFNILKNDLDSLKDFSNELSKLQAKALAQDITQVKDIISKTETILKEIVESKSTPKKKSVGKQLPLAIKLPKLTWDTKLPRGYSFIVNARYKRGNRVVTRRLGTTPNRADKLMERYIDGNLRASYDLVVIGKRKVKDIKYKKSGKFTTRKGKDARVRHNVEKVKYRLDRPREKAISRMKRTTRAKSKPKRTIKRKPTRKKAKSKPKKTVRKKSKAKTTKKRTKQRKK